MKHYRIHYNLISSPNVVDDVKLDVPDGVSLKAKMESYFTLNHDIEPNAVIDMSTNQFVDRSFWGFMVDESRSIFDSHDDGYEDDIEGERAFMRAEGQNRQLSEDEQIIYGL